MYQALLERLMYMSSFLFPTAQRGRYVPIPILQIKELRQRNIKDMEEAELSSKLRQSDSRTLVLNNRGYTILSHECPAGNQKCRTQLRSLIIGQTWQLSKQRRQVQSQKHGKSISKHL